MRTNRVVTIPRYGGLIGMFSSRAHVLGSQIDRYNNEGWNVVQVLEAEKGNLLVTMLSLLVLCFTFFLWTFMPSYMVILEKDQ
ncbi:MAG: hypothetical protein RBU37_26730 [Myxococcota bacterium]|nr:hypothetical protein [Myxococcota bacterium]